MTWSLKRTPLLLTPLALAYASHGAKTGLSLFVVSLLTMALCLRGNQTRAVRSVPAKPLIWLAVFFGWCWTGPLMGAPLDSYLMAYSRLILYAISGLLIFQFSDDSTLSKFEELLIGLGVMEAIFIGAAKIQGHDVQIGGYLKNSIHSGLLLPISMVVALEKGNRFDKRGWGTALLWGAVFFMGWSLFEIRSRAGLLSFAAALLYLYPRKFISIGFGAALFFLAWGLYRGRLFIFNLELDAFNFKSTLGRLNIWSTALRAIASRPIFGFGLGNFETGYLLFQQPSREFLHFGKSTIFAHNIFLQVASETGLVGAGLFLTTLAMMLKKAYRLVWKERTLFSILIVFFITGLFNYVMFLPFSGFVAVAAIALLAAKNLSPNEAPSKKGVVRQGPWIALIPVLIFLASHAASEVFQKKGRWESAARACPIRAEAWYALALENLSQGRDALPWLNQALYWNPTNGFTWQRRALVLAAFYPTERQEILRSFKQAQTHSPFHAPFYLQEGFYRLSTEPGPVAVELFQHAAALEPMAPLPHYGLGLAYAGIKERKAAKEELETARVLKRQQATLENEPQFGYLYKDLFSSAYAQFLFGVEEEKIDRALLKL